LLALAEAWVRSETAVGKLLLWGLKQLRELLHASG
jgi:hypothetical protein